MDFEGEVGHAPEGYGGNFTSGPVVDIANVDRVRDPTKSGYLSFEPGGVFTINWKLRRGPVSKSIRSHSGETIFRSQEEANWLINYNNPRGLL